MATGIVSTAAQLLGWQTLSWALFILNLVFYCALVMLLLMRVVRFRDRFHADFRSHARAAGFMSIVAATAIVGTEFVVRWDRPAVALVLWCTSLLLWVALVYGFFAVMTVLRDKPPLEEGLNASWMLLVVSTQSVSVLGTLISPALGSLADAMLAFTTAMFLLGCMFYMLLFSLILYRFLFFELDVVRMSPPYWINMGAVAVTTLAGSLLVLHSSGAQLTGELVPFIRGFTLLFWATATWWFPLLLILGAWRHIVHRVPFSYSIEYWSMVFPLGMYSVATYRLTEALGWEFLVPLPLAVGWVAVAAWVVTFFAMGTGREI